MRGARRRWASGRRPARRGPAPRLDRLGHADEGPPRPVDGDQSLGAQLADRLPHGGAADAVLLRQPQLAGQRLAGTELTRSIWSRSRSASWRKTARSAEGSIIRQQYVVTMLHRTVRTKARRHDVTAGLRGRQWSEGRPPSASPGSSGPLPTVRWRLRLDDQAHDARPHPPEKPQEQISRWGLTMSGQIIQRLTQVGRHVDRQARRMPAKLQHHLAFRGRTRPGMPAGSAIPGRPGAQMLRQVIAHHERPRSAR